VARSGDRDRATTWLEEAPGIVDQVEGLGACKDGGPADDGAGHEVGVCGFEDAIAAAGHGGYGIAKQSFGDCVPKRSWGTRRVPVSEIMLQGGDASILS
jgi:hypothetical protein